MKFKWSALPWVCFAMCVGVMGTALISPLYPLYKAAWQLRTSDISLIYVVYMVGALSGLLFMGRLSNVLGFRKVMLLGLGLGWVGTFLTLIAWNVPILNVGRFIVGLSSSLIVTSASVGLTQLSPSGASQRVSMLTSFLLAFGFGIGPVLGGMFGQWIAHPLVLTYIPSLLLSALAIYALWRVDLSKTLAPPVPEARLKWGDFIPTLNWTSKRDAIGFALTCVCPFFAFGVFGLYASMAPLFLVKMVPWHGPMVSGGSIGVILLCSSIVQLLCYRLRVRWCGLLGLWLIALSNALLIANFSFGLTWIFTVGVVAAAAGHGLSLLAGISMVNRIAQPEERAGLLSTYLVSGYVGSIVPMIGIGWIADHYGLPTAITVFGTAVILTAVPLGVWFAMHKRMRLS